MSTTEKGLKVKNWWMRHLIFSAVVILIGSAIAIYEAREAWNKQQKTRYIALVGPMSGPDQEVGLAMERSAQLYLERLDEGREKSAVPIELLVFDDQGHQESAVRVAKEIVSNDDILLVLGHHSRETAAAASPIYQAAEMPVIAGTMTADEVIAGNPWFFSLLPTEVSQGAQIAAFINKVLGERKASVIHDEGSYGTSLLEGFTKTAESTGLEIGEVMSFDSNSESVDVELERIAQQFRSAEDPGFIFLATHQAEGVKLITSLHGRGLRFFGPDSFSNEQFITILKNYPQEKVKPGYFIDGVFSTMPVILDIAQRQAKEFHHAFVERYQDEPDWVSAAYWDAAMLGVKAIDAVLQESPRKKDVDNSLTRLRVKENLSYTNMPERSVPGVMGNIQFDALGAAVRPFPVGVFNGHREVSYKEQLQLVRDIRRIENPLNEILEGRLLYQNRHFNHRTRVIYTGIDINEIANLNTSDSSFTADFYIWFRTDVELDPAQIEFLNTVEPIVLDEPIIQKENEDGLVTYTFRVRSNFRGDFNFYRYPFDSQELPIRFKHRVMTRDQLIFVPDVLGMRIGDGYGKTQEASLQTISGWDYDGSLFYQDDISNSSSLGVEDFFEDSYALEYSRFNATVVIARDATSFILKNLFPMLFVMLLAYVPFYITNFAPRLNMVASSLLTAAFFHLKLSSGIAVGYLVAIEYFFFGVYFLIGLAVIESIVAHRLVENAGNAGEDKERLLAIFHKLDWISRASFPVLTILIVYLVIVSFDGFSSF